jgi:His-Xaa-Ser system radical SAM maturase HxsC
MRRILAHWKSAAGSQVHRVTRVEALASEWRPDLNFLLLVDSTADQKAADRIGLTGLKNVGTVVAPGLEDGDVVVPRDSEGILVLHRESDIHHSLLMTNRCNSYCLMCSQPPTSHDDAWLVDEAVAVIRHIRNTPRSIGLTGGEPLLLGSRLRHVIEALAEAHPTTRIEVLTNGRLFGSSDIGPAVLEGINSAVTWLVPLYGHADFLHDFVVQSPGAFEETISGLLVLQEHQQQIQLRIVLIEPVLRHLPELCSFIGRNLPFVHEVALMACEPIGFALANRDVCDVDLTAWQPSLESACWTLQRYQVPFVFMNTPLCALPRWLHPHARQSISDWKNCYAEECGKCTVRSDCAGLFAWHERGWKPTKIKAVLETS